MYTKYIVQKGDSLYKIANYYNTTPETIMKLNNLNGYLIYPNQVLVVPGKENQYLTEPGDTINLIIQKSGLTIEELLSQNKIFDFVIVPNQIIKLEKEAESKKSFDYQRMNNALRSGISNE